MRRLARASAALVLSLPMLCEAHSDDWCADAVDFAMGAAQNLELGYPLQIIISSIDRDPSYYQRMFEQLSPDDLKQITNTVYANRWSRFEAAQGLTETCVPE